MQVSSREKEVKVKERGICFTKGLLDGMSAVITWCWVRIEHRSRKHFSSCVRVIREQTVNIHFTDLAAVP